MPNQKVWNFSAGPAVMPQSVLEKAASELSDWNGCGMSVMELSHRSKEFGQILAKAQADFRELLKIPDNYKVLWMQGGATSQFSSVVYNLLGDPKKTADYVVTGGWSEKALEEAERLGIKVNTVISTKKTGHRGIEDGAQLNFTPAQDAAYVYYCDNETVHGVEFPTVLHGVDPTVPIVCDMSSNILSRTVDVSKYGVIFAGAQKNIGPAGVTVVIVREDLLGTRMHPNLTCPIMMDFKLCADNDSMYNTPPTYGIYMAGLVFQWLLDQGGVPAIAALNERKSSKLYNFIDSSNGFYRSLVQKKFRSRMNIPFRMFEGEEASPKLEEEFLKGAEKLRMTQLKGHRSVGGIRASIYNAMSEEGVDALLQYMKEFQTLHQK
ncbi:phosphoserine aminotransferase [Phlyctochytrium arcticum]|nr:phosphoserine aminotransferase [Phlyctochytrium arcticum]